MNTDKQDISYQCSTCLLGELYDLIILIITYYFITQAIFKIDS
jgi:hypothetical protein